MPTKRSLALAVPAFSGSPRSLVATVQHVADGDTVTTISANGTKLRIRLLGINAPEITHGSKQGSFSVSRAAIISTT
ncbi:MAG: thermonuclease family protein [Candidatus Methylomirabilales bacterium]